ncbi:hypothetical protein INT45_003991 [Circinella minor]|uniref:Uncharacterized protein n=1 Tax=Circinella minor TaxID=1195481 RepID=A0A8H7RUR8_9FUNG|nr:hypothetical protein INT45_003991 [Circinella minor]
MYADVIARHHPDEDTVIHIQSVYDLIREHPASVSSSEDFKKTPTFHFLGRTSKAERKAFRRQHRRPHRPFLRYRLEDHCLIGYRDERFRPSMQGHAPVPVETLRAVLAYEHGEALNPTSRCDDLVDVVGYRRNVYTLKFCEVCHLLLNHDLHGGRNIGRILLAYIQSNGDINSRPAALSRGNHRAALNDENDDDFDEKEENLNGVME